MTSKSNSNNKTDNEYEDESEEWTIDRSNSDFMGPYAYKGNQWISYDDFDIIRKKTEYVANHSLGGTKNTYDK